MTSWVTVLGEMWEAVGTTPARVRRPGLATVGVDQPLGGSDLSAKGRQLRGPFLARSVFEMNIESGRRGPGQEVAMPLDGETGEEAAALWGGSRADAACRGR